MSFDIQSIRSVFAPAVAGVPAASDANGRQEDRVETLVTAAATTVAVLIVALIAIVMGLA